MPKIIENPSDVILEHARKILFDEGYENLSIRNVARSCGIGVGTIYNYFPTKKDLVRQVIQCYWEQYIDFLDKVEKGQLDLFEKIKLCYERLEDDVSTFKGLWVKICMDSNVEIVHAEMEKRKSFIERLVRKFESLLKGELDKQPQRFDMPLDSYNMSKFIVQNFMLMSINKQFEYAYFETILKKLFQQR